METLDLLEVRFIGAFICALLVSMILLSIYLSIFLLSMIISLCQVLSASLELWRRCHGVECQRLPELWLCCLIRKSSTQGSKPLPASVLRRNIASHEARYFLTYYSISCLTILYLMVRCIIQINSYPRHDKDCVIACKVEDSTHQEKCKSLLERTKSWLCRCFQFFFFTKWSSMREF